ncbi:MAG: cell division protein ZapA [Myxococcaceae bacterium]|nr:cell division protein ZapA [Myxococcaceae bacterium]MBH2006190.1 cell division protein ZapA [Myxococcaceae bacterium]
MNSGEKRKVEVTLQGQRFQVRTEKSDAYLHGLANFVSSKLEEIKRAAKTASAHQMSLLLNMNLADQLFEKEEQLNRLKTNLALQAQNALLDVNTVLNMLPENAQGLDEEADQPV